MSDDLSRLILHPNFETTLKELGDRNVFLPPGGDPQGYSSWVGGVTDVGKLTALDNQVRAYDLDATAGQHAAEDFTLCAYDESWLKFDALEGTAYFTTHALVVVAESDYLPVVLATFNFYTRSKALTERSEFIKYSGEVDVDYHRDYLRDKVAFLVEHVPPKCLLLIDGPLLAGDLFTIMVDGNSRLLEKEVLPVFFVKNSFSNIVTENIEELRGRFNSDMHWLNGLLRAGQRSSFFSYQDLHNDRNSKVFAYLKSLDVSPQRVEFHADTFKKYETSIPQVMDLIYYLMLAQGSFKNPQARPIAVAEAYARKLLQYVDIEKQFKRARITPTMNQTRFGG